ncbi:MAG: 1-deoxy-D-xylulose-5-phosphate reductoisomerase [Acidimicrobiia bacterium]|nr:MAG: 1-deoxy-D-xylulose-5-phosphate reductoisomerase [Acidimicrobiia bacterium]
MARSDLRPVVVLGATGSIGAQTLDVADRLGFPVVGLAAGHRSAALDDLADRYPDARVAVAAADGDIPTRFGVGNEAVAELATIPGSIVVNGIVGAAGLEPTLAGLNARNRVALANKESLVTGGPLVLEALATEGAELLPVDSEHSAIWQCMAGEDANRVRRVVLTASGGPLLGKSRHELAGVTVDEALAHPTWEMGNRITIDSATLMNKAFEVIEAHFLFGLDFDQIDVVVHPQSYVHAFVEFVDGVVKAELGAPDMRKPIQVALTYPERASDPQHSFDVVGTDLSFLAPDRTAFPALDLGYEAGRRGGNAPAVLNAADEIAVTAFLDGRIPFTTITDIVAHSLDAVPQRSLESLGDALAADAAGRQAATEGLANISR